MTPKKQFASIHSRMLITSLLPLILLCWVLASYMITEQRSVLEGNLLRNGVVLTQQIAGNAEFSIYSNNEEALTKLGESVLDIPVVSGIVFYNNSQKTLVNVGTFDERALDLLSVKTPLRPHFYDHHWYFYADIIKEISVVQDYDEEALPATEILGWVLIAVSDEMLIEENRNGIFAVLVVSSMGFLIAAWFSMRIGRSISRPVEHLTEMVESMEAGNLNYVAEEDGPTEIRKLASGVNQLAASVRQSNVRMQSEVARATAQLQITLIELENAMEAQEQFLARMSHELRTPLTAVIGFSKLIAIETDAVKREEHLRIVSMSSNMLLTMIDDILEFSKAKVGGFTLENIPFSVQPWLEDLIAIHLPAAEKKGLSLTFTISEDLPAALIGDPVRFIQVISNLLSNAVKFTETGGIEVVIGCQSIVEGNVVLECWVSDSGKGIDETKIPRLFDPFTQEDTSINRRFGGTGLGLSICKSLVQAMGGDIKVHSEVGVGSVFTFTYHLRATDDSALTGFTETAVHKTHKSEALEGLTVLVAEDNFFNQRFIVRILNSYGAECLIADNGLEAIDIAKRLHVDAILMDIHMPVVDGITACETIVQQPGESPPIIAITADVTLAERERIIKAGAALILLKPLNEEELIEGLMSLVTRSNATLSFAPGGLLSSVVPVDELKSALYSSLSKLEIQLQTDDKASLREIIHDLLGLAGLYGMSELRAMVVTFKSDYGSLDAEANIERVQQIRRHIEEFLVS